jgi:Arc/MetJ family transcription regulator
MKIEIDEKKIAEIMQLAQFDTREEAVNAALDVFLKQIRRGEVLNWKGDNSWDGDLMQMRSS